MLFSSVFVLPLPEKLCLQGEETAARNITLLVRESREDLVIGCIK